MYYLNYPNNYSLKQLLISPFYCWENIDTMSFKFNNLQRSYLSWDLRPLLSDSIAYAMNSCVVFCLPNTKQVNEECTTLYRIEPAHLPFMFFSSLTFQTSFLVTLWAGQQWAGWEERRCHGGKADLEAENQMVMSFSFLASLAATTEP